MGRRAGIRILGSQARLCDMDGKHIYLSRWGKKTQVPGKQGHQDPGDRSGAGVERAVLLPLFLQPQGGAPEVGSGWPLTLSKLQNLLQNPLHSVMCSTGTASADTALATLFPSHHPPTPSVSHQSRTTTPAGRAWTTHLSPARHGHSGEDENSGSLETDGSYQPGASQLPAQPGTVLGAHIPVSGLPLLLLGPGGPLTFGVRYLVIISFPFSPSFSSGVTSYSA